MGAFLALDTTQYGPPPQRQEPDGDQGLACVPSCPGMDSLGLVHSRSRMPRFLEGLGAPWLADDPGEFLLVFKRGRREHGAPRGNHHGKAACPLPSVPWQGRADSFRPVHRTPEPPHRVHALMRAPSLRATS